MAANGHDAIETLSRVSERAAGLIAALLTGVDGVEQLRGNAFRPAAADRASRRLKGPQADP